MGKILGVAEESDYRGAVGDSVEKFWETFSRILSIGWILKDNILHRPYGTPGF
jgi:hypothetical protein